MILVLVIVIDVVVVEDDLGIYFFYFNILPQIIEKSLFLFFLRELCHIGGIFLRGGWNSFC